jgi:hypothetical protein
VWIFFPEILNIFYLEVTIKIHVNLEKKEKFHQTPPKFRILKMSCSCCFQTPEEIPELKHEKDQNIESHFAQCEAKHWLCKFCIQKFLQSEQGMEIMLQEGSVLCFTSETKCNQIVQMLPSVRNFLKREYKNASLYSTRKSLKPNEKLLLCHGCSEHFVSTVEDFEQPYIECPKCGWGTCTKCFSSYSDGENFGNHLKKCQPYLTEQKQKYKDYDFLDNDFSFDPVTQLSVSQCPKSKIGKCSQNYLISKINGCNRMQCKECKTDWCHFCTQSLEGLDDVYSHFQAAGCPFEGDGSDPEQKQLVRSRLQINHVSDFRELTQLVERYVNHDEPLFYSTHDNISLWNPFTSFRNPFRYYIPVEIITNEVDVAFPEIPMKSNRLIWEEFPRRRPKYEKKFRYQTSAPKPINDTPIRDRLKKKIQRKQLS